MKNLVKVQIELAKQMGFDYIISLCHPDNISSKKTIMNLGLEYAKTETVNDTYLRDIFIMKL